MEKIFPTKEKEKEKAGMREKGKMRWREATKKRWGKDHFSVLLFLAATSTTIAATSS
jgi:hypothetical protein